MPGWAGPPYVAVVGAGDVDLSSEPARQAEEIAARVARAGAVVVCGGLGGVMAAACRGATQAGGTALGLLPGRDRRTANPWVTVAVATGLGEARNAVVVTTADAVVAVGGEYGTLSEIALALKAGKPVVGLGTWELRRRGTVDPAVVAVPTPAAAVAAVLALLPAT